MTKDIHQYLRDSGYLDSPANRFLWRNATPTLRHHLRQWLVLAISSTLPIALLIAAVTTSRGWDRLILALFYWLTGLIAFTLLDLAIGLVMRLIPMERFWSENRLLNMITPIWFALFLLGGVRFLHSNLTLKPPAAQLFAWAGLALFAWIAAKACWLLVISRLYWHGIRPPKRNNHPWLTVAAIAVIALSMLLQSFWRRTMELPTSQSSQPVFILAFDLPAEDFDTYNELFPPWAHQNMRTDQDDITDFWTSFGTGTTTERHRASLVTFRAPIFQGSLNRQEPTHQLPLFFMEPLGLLEPLAGSGRYRKYWWEILDKAGARTFTYAYWHTFPASARRGGVLTERWSETNRQPPYLAGIEPTSTIIPPPLNAPDALSGTIDREAQTWAQLIQRAERRDFDFCIAYFPLADLIRDTNTPEALRQDLLAYRQAYITSLLDRLDEDVRLGIVFASGRPGASESGIQVRIFSNWLDQAASPIEDPLQIAPTLLNFFGLPADRFMMASRLINQPIALTKRIDYGEPTRNISPGQLDDEAYYEELKSLGYVQ